MSCIRSLCSYRDIAELTQQVNHLDNQLNEISEQNEALRERCDLGEGEIVDVGPLRVRRNAELDQLRKDKQNLEQQVQCISLYGQYPSPPYACTT